MGADTWELERDLYLASQGSSVEIGKRLGLSDVMRLTRELQSIRARCSHDPNPTKPERCYKCGAPSVERPGLAKAGQVALVSKRTA